MPKEFKNKCVTKSITKSYKTGMITGTGTRIKTNKGERKSEFVCATMLQVLIQEEVLQGRQQYLHTLSRCS